MNDILKFIGKDNCKVVGCLDQKILGIAPIQEANTGDLTFCKKSDGATSLLQSTKASLVICDSEIDIKEVKDKTLILIKRPRLWFIRVAKKFFPPDSQSSIHPTAIINWPCVKIGKNVKIGPGCTIGFDGFGYEKNEEGAYELFPHYGKVIIGDDVEIRANVNIDRGNLGDTVIGAGTKIDCLTHIAHNVQIGKNCIIVCLVCIAGSAQIGDNSWIAPGAIIRNKIKVGKNVVVGMGAVVTKDVEDDITVVGNPAHRFER